MKLIPNESWDIELFEITEILCILSMCLMWEGMKSQELASDRTFGILEGNFKQSFYTSKKILQLI